MADYTPSINVQYLSEENKSYSHVIFQGDIDKAGLAVIKDDLEKYQDTFDRDILVFDFKEMSFINSEGIGYLLTVYYRLLKKNKRLVIINANEHVKDVLNVIGMTRIIGCYDSIVDFEKTLTN